MSILDRMSDATRKEMLAGLFLSKFNTHESKAGLQRLGYARFKDAYEGLAALVGGNPRSVHNYRDEFDAVFENGRTGYSMRPMYPTRKEMLAVYGGMELEEMAELLEEQFLGTEKFAHDLDAAMESSSSGVEVAEKAVEVAITDVKHFLSGNIDPTSDEGIERIAKTRVRVTQARFRKWVLSIYDGACCVTGLAVPEVLRASHIVGWADDTKNRMNPSNGLCLSATYDAAFDKHLISFDDDLRMILSKSIRDFCTNEVHSEYFARFEGKRIALPRKFSPDKTLLAKHRNLLVA